MNWARLKDGFIDFILVNKINIIIFSSLFFVGLVTGIITLSQITEVFTLDEVADIVLRETIIGNVGFFSYFFKRFLECLVCMGFSFLLCLNFYTSFINYIFLFYRGYLFGTTISMCIALFGVGGAINIIIFYIPFQLVLQCILICFCSCSMEFALNRHRYGKCYKFNCSFIWIFIIITALICLIESIFLPPLLKSIIYVA